ncbi:hypothetical protein [Sphingomonas endolithica]|uniref:hypothetical protein n=1 Tax=Sphingomonas endolithica TaxID=2972485 RepID=UPI0021AF1E9B|nr:hypothetical protein [Sphingomonas sp. ZFBP2030]
MKVETDAGEVIELGTTETAPTIGITDFSRRVTDDFGVTTVVERGFARRMSVRLAVPFDDVDELQRRLAALRATSALWVADDRYDSLQVRGFYKDFQVDLATSPLSSCTLTIEGLVASETTAEVPGDPAPLDSRSTLQLLQPVIVTPAMLVASNVAEADYAEWSASTAYPVGARVIKAATHRIYESAGGSNFGNDPAGVAGKWIDVGPTKRWAMFDQALGSATTSSTAIEVTLQAGSAVTSLAILDTNAATVRVRAPGYDRTQAFDEAGSALFLDLVAAAGTSVTVTLTPAGATPVARPWDDGTIWSDAPSWRDVIPAGDGTVSVGTLLIGSLKALGVTEAAPTAGITDYSRKEADDFGAVTIVERAWAKRMTTKSLIRTDAIDAVSQRIAAVRATPSLWIGQAGLDILTIYGFFKDYSIEVGETLSKLSLSIEGLSKAAPIPRAPVVLVPRGPYDAATIYGEGDVVQYQGSSWTYIATTASSGNAPPALPTEENEYWRVFARAGLDGVDGRDGLNGSNGTPGQSSYLHIAYANSANGQVDFTTGAPGSRTYLGTLVDQASADSTNPNAYTWSLIKGADGLNGANGSPGANGADGQPTYVHIAYSNAANGSVDFSVDNPANRSYVGFYVDQTLADSTNLAAYTWSLVKGADGLNGTNGAPGAPGANGQTSYFHTAYANSPTGSIDFTTGSPAGRAFIGTYSDFTAADSANPATYDWTAYKGPASFGLTARGDVAVASSSLVKTATSTWGGGGGFSTEGWGGGAQTSFKLSTTETFAGLNADPSADDGYTTIDYAFHASIDGLTFIFESGVGTLIGPTDFSSTFQIVYDNAQVRYYINGSLVRQVSAPADKVLYFDAAIAGPVGNRISDINFSGAGRAGVDGPDGLNGTNGAPGGSGSNGQTSYVHVAYADSTNGATSFTTGAPGTRKYIGILTNFTAADSENYADYTWSKLTGDNGLNGADGTRGADGADGQPSYVHFAYANSPNGGVDFHVSDPTGRAYVGIYTDQTLADSTNPAAYTWSLVKGADGTNGANGVDGFTVDAIAPFIIPVFSSGAAKPSWTGGSGAIRLRKGANEITSGVTYTIESATDMAGMAISGQTFSFAGVTAEKGSFVAVATYGGVAYRTTVAVKKVFDGSAAFRGSVALAGANTFNGGSGVGAGQTPIPGGSTVLLSASVNYSAPNSGNTTSSFTGRVYLYYQNITDNGPRTLLGSVVGSASLRRNRGTAQEPDMETQSGTVSASFAFASAATDKIYSYDAVLASEFGGSYNVTASGTLKMEVTG